MKKIGKMDLEELVLMAKDYPESALIIAHGEGLIEGINRAKAKFSEKYKFDFDSGFDAGVLSND